MNIHNLSGAWSKSMAWVAFTALAILAIRPGVAVGGSPGGAIPPSASAAQVVELGRKPDAAYGDFAKSATVEGEGLRLSGARSQGGAVFNDKLDLSALAALAPVLRVKTGAGNKALRIAVILKDAHGASATFSFALPPAGREYTAVPSESGATLAGPSRDAAKKQASVDLANIRQVQVTGDWQGKPVEATVSRLEFIPPTPAMLAEAARRKAKEEQARARQEEERARLSARKAQLLQACPHPADGPEVTAMGLVAADILGVTIQEGRLKLEPVRAFDPATDAPALPKNNNKRSPKPDAGKSNKKDKTLFVERAGRLEEVPAPQPISGMVNGVRRKIGAPSLDGRWLQPSDRGEGAPLETAALEDPAAYAISSRDDERYGTPLAPLAVFRKSKPNGPTDAEGTAPALHHLYLKLPHPPREGATYAVRFKALNTREETRTWKHDSRTVVSEALHVNALGYRPEDPLKRAYLSIWLGTGGGYEHQGLDKFELIEAATGKTAFTGRIELAKAKDADERLQTKKNYAQTAVFRLDFSAFREPGNYRVHVPGLGVSEAFPLAQDVWARAYRVAMQGFVNQRSGVALGPPATAYRRPRNYHPDDGVHYFQLGLTLSQGQEGERAADLLKQWQAKGKLEPAPAVWGGYMDAGDWDTLNTHLNATWLLLELAELRPQFTEQTRFELPPDGVDAKVPALLREALWNLAGQRRLQRSDGAVHGGFGDCDAARPAETSWTSSAPKGVYAVSRLDTLRYGAVAAKGARVLAQYDAKSAEGYKASAVAAWTWALSQPATNTKTAGQEDAWQAAAAVELYWLTGDQAFHEAAKRLLAAPLARPEAELRQWADACFTYVRLPAAMADPILQAAARKAFIAGAERAIRYAEKNAFNIVTETEYMPVFEYTGFFTVPGIQSRVLPRAHYLTGDARYLAATVQSCNFALGANPDNLVYTTGLSPRSVRWPLHLDSRRTGQRAPAGITVYGPSDQSTVNPASMWVHAYALAGRVQPKLSAWPVQESYVDMFVWPGCNEYTVHQCLGPVAYTWGYLAATQP